MNVRDTFRVLARGAVAAVLVAAWVGCSSTPELARSVAIVEPTDGATVTSPFVVRFGVRGMAVAPAGEILANSGHHHLLINTESIPSGESVPFSEKHMHFGKGQTEAEVKLSPGTYKLTAQFANGAHQSYGKGMSQTISVTVK